MVWQNSYFDSRGSVITKKTKYVNVTLLAENGSDQRTLHTFRLVLTCTSRCCLDTGVSFRPPHVTVSCSSCCGCQLQSLHQLVGIGRTCLAYSLVYNLHSQDDVVLVSPVISSFWISRAKGNPPVLPETPATASRGELHLLRVDKQACPRHPKRLHVGTCSHLLHTLLPGIMHLSIDIFARGQ